MPWVLRRLVDAGSAALGVDPLMVAMPVLAVCASAIGSTRRIKVKASWREFPVLWVIVVARSGQQKSPAFDLALQPLKKREHKASLDHEDDLLRHRESRAQYDVEFGQWKNDAKGMQIPPPTPTEPAAPVRRRYYTSDATVEAIASLLHDNPRGILMGRDEVSGWLLGFNAYKGGRGGDEAAWMELSRGGTLLVDRKSGDRKTLHCDHACVSVCGTIQPKLLVRCLRTEQFASGLAARLLMAMPDSRKRAWTDADISEDVVAGYDTVVERLLELRHLDGKPVDLPMTKEALKTFVKFYSENADRIYDAINDDLASALTKIEGYATRLALIIHMVRLADGEVDECDMIDDGDMAAGVALAGWFAAEAARIYWLFRRDASDQEASELVAKLKTMKDDFVTVRALMRASKYKKSKDARMALDDLVWRGWATMETLPAGEKGGRPTTYYCLVDPPPPPPEEPK